MSRCLLSSKADSSSDCSCSWGLIEVELYCLFVAALQSLIWLARLPQGRSTCLSSLPLFDSSSCSWISVPFCWFSFWSMTALVVAISMLSYGCYYLAWLLSLLSSSTCSSSVSSMITWCLRPLIYILFERSFWLSSSWLSSLFYVSLIKSMQ